MGYRCFGSVSGDHVKDAVILLGLIGVQVVNGAYMVLMKRFLTQGVSPLFVVVIASFITSAYVLPFAIKLERQKWPAKLRPTVVAQLVLISIGGVTASPVLMLMGVKKTSATIATAMPNLGPGLVFLIAVCCRIEKFDIRNKFSTTKVFGTLVCVCGALGMSFLQGSSASRSDLTSIINTDWTIGCLIVLASVTIVSGSTVLQAATMMGGFPAPLTMCAITSFMGAVFTAIVQIIMEGKLSIGSDVVSVWSFFLFMIVAGVATGSGLGFQAWCVKQKGPVIVSIFNPVNTVCSAILSALVLGQVISLGGYAGMVLIFVGLYIFLWAQKKEGSNIVHDDGGLILPTNDVEKPLLS